LSNRNLNKPFPPVSEVLLKELNERFPEQTPDQAWDDREIWIRVGQRKVVKFLNEQFARQNENILNREES
jgi:Ni,Fe-hydrogenase III component G